MIDAILRTDRLLLRPLGPDDAPKLLHYVQRNRTWLEPWEPRHPPSYFTLEGQRSILMQCQEDRRMGSGVLFGIFEREASHPEVLGRISVSGIVRGIWQNGFLGYSIAHSRAGQGYMTEALRRVVLFSFADLNLHRVQASILPRNTASLRVAEKCGFRYEGRSRRYLKINDVWEDHEIFALTVEDLREQELERRRG